MISIAKNGVTIDFSRRQMRLGLRVLRLSRSSRFVDRSSHGNPDTAHVGGAAHGRCAATADAVKHVIAQHTAVAAEAVLVFGLSAD